MNRISNSRRFGDGAGIKWLVLPWQPLVASDRAVLSAVEESLVNSLDTTLIVHTCQFVTNVMLQDFPAEVFLQRPAIVLILQTLLERSRIPGNKVIPGVVKTLYKLTRSLRYRMYYYCDPCIANKRPSTLSGQSECSWAYESSEEDRESPEGGLPEANYQAYQQQYTGSQDSPTVYAGTGNVDEAPLQQQQLLIPTYCVETLKQVLSLLALLPLEAPGPLRNIKNMLDLSLELVNLLTTSLVPSIWLATDSLSLGINDNLKGLMRLLGELMEYYGPSGADHSRITYLRVVCLASKFLSAIVPLELADIVVPKILKVFVTRAVMDAPIFLMYPGLSATLEQYARLFNDPEAIESMRLFDETRFVSVSLKAAIDLMRDRDSDVARSNTETLKLMWTAKSSLSHHKRLSLVKKYIIFLQETTVLLDKDDGELANKLLLYLLSNADADIRRSAYAECARIVSSALGVEARQMGKFAWLKVAFLSERKVMTEIVCHGAAGDDETIRSLSEDIIVYIMKGKIHLGEEGWSKLLEEALIPILGLVQCLAGTTTQLGLCVTKMLDPDVYASIKLPFIEVLKGNARLLYAADSALREEALCRLIFLLGREKDSLKKLPRLSSLHGLPLSSLCILERSSRSFKRSEGSYQTSSLLSVLELIRAPDVEPKVRKSALVQISVMLTDTYLHKLFIRENGVTLVLDIMDKSLVEREYENYPDSVIPILSILKVLASTQTSVRHDLSTRPEVYSNILRGLFLFPSNECAKIDASQLLCLLLYSEYIAMPTRESEYEVMSLPHIIATRMRLPINCKSHWKTSVHQRADLSILNGGKSAALTFVRQFWAWNFNEAEATMRFDSRECPDDSDISEKLRITEDEFLSLRHTSIYYCVKEQLVNIQNSTTHLQVAAALDYLSMYLELWKMLRYESSMEDLKKLSWEQSFVRFLLSQPTNKEDCELFVEVLNFLYGYINAELSGQNGAWLCNVIRKNVTRSLSDSVGTMNTDNQEVHEAVLKLVTSASAIEETQQVGDDLVVEDSWINFIELIVANLCFGDQQHTAEHQQKHPQQQQHFYNLAYLDRLLRCLTYLTSKCQWQNHRNLLTSLGNALIELIVSFYGAGTVSFMGLSITRNSIICLNHLLYEMQCNFSKNEWKEFWYDDDRNLSWLPMLWRNRDPLVRASAFQLLAALTKADHTACQLLKIISLAPSDLCHTLLRYVTNREECCIVREQACIALANLVKNSNRTAFQYVDSLKSNALVICIEQSNIYYEISVLCSNIYLGATLEHHETTRSEISESLDVNDDDDEENCSNFVATPSLISVTCTLLNNLILVGGFEVAKHIYEQSLDKYFLGCFGDIPAYDELERKTLSQYCDILEMYISLCTLLTNCMTHCQEFAVVASFSSETMYLLLRYLEKERYFEEEGRVAYLRKSLSTEVYNFLSALSLTESGQQHMETITSSEFSGPQTILSSISQSMKESLPELRMSSIGCLASLLSQEIQRSSDDEIEKKNIHESAELSLSSVLDTTLVISSDSLQNDDYHLRQVLSSINKLSVAKNSIGTPNSVQENASGRERGEQRVPLGCEISKNLIHLFIAHNYAKSKNLSNFPRDKDIVIGALSNLLCVSAEAKKNALGENLGETCLLILKEFHTEFTLQPYQIHETKTNRDKKFCPLLNDTRRVFGLLMNFMYNSVEVKERLAKAGLADVLHKLWAWISLDDKTIASVLELVATFTTNCSEDFHIMEKYLEFSHIFLELMRSEREPYLYSPGELLYERTILKKCMHTKDFHTMEKYLEFSHIFLELMRKEREPYLCSPGELLYERTILKKCMHTKGSHSLTLTTALHGSGLRRTPNTASLLHSVISLVGREIDKVGRHFNNQKLHFAFHVLRNAVHVHECRVAISKSNLLQFFGKIHPAATKRAKPWPLLEVYCLEFLNDFTFYEEGQVCVPKAPDGLDVLIELARSNTPATRLLAISTLRNLVFNSSNRPRLLATVSFINLLRTILESSSFSEIGIAATILWSLVSNNQKGKLTIRSAGFSQRIQEVLGRLTLLSTPDDKQRQDLAKILHYSAQLLSSSENFAEVLKNTPTKERRNARDRAGCSQRYCCRRWRALLPTALSASSLSSPSSSSDPIWLTTENATKTRKPLPGSLKKISCVTRLGNEIS